MTSLQVPALGVGLRATDFEDEFRALRAVRHNNDAVATELGISEATIKDFLENQSFSPLMQTYLIAAILQLENVNSQGELQPFVRFKRHFAEERHPRQQWDSNSGLSYEKRAF